LNHPTPEIPAPTPQSDRDWFRQATKFGVVGISNTLVDWGIYYILTRWLGLSALPVIAKAISYGAGILNSYIWNKRWTFRSQQQGVRPLLLFVGVNLIGMGFNALALKAGLFFGISELLSLLLATSATLLWNFLLSKQVVFRR